MKDSPQRAGAPSAWQALLEALFGAEARSHLLRYGSHALLIGLGALAVWLAGLRLPQNLPASPAAGQSAAAPAGSESTTAGQIQASFVPASFSFSAEIIRLAQIHTDRPAEVRNEIKTYLVQPGDTLFGIAQKFGLKPESIFWSNRITLNDDAHSLAPGMEFLIPPVDGIAHKVLEGETLVGIATYAGVTPEDIINWPSNNLDPDVKPEEQQLTPGQLLVIPGGTGKAISAWSPPAPPPARPGSSTVHGATSSGDGPGACPGTYNRVAGTGYFVWPGDHHYLSGTDFTSFHAGIDIAAGMGEPVYAADGGVAIWAGWNNYGYGNMVLLDHGNGWTTLYGHLSQWNVSCYQVVSQGQVIGLAGSTGRSSGPHLHFETAYNGVRINPWTVLPGQ